MTDIILGYIPPIRTEMSFFSCLKLLLVTQIVQIPVFGHSGLITRDSKMVGLGVLVRSKFINLCVLSSFLESKPAILGSQGIPKGFPRANRCHFE